MDTSSKRLLHHVRRQGIAYPKSFALLMIVLGMSLSTSNVVASPIFGTYTTHPRFDVMYLYNVERGVDIGDAWKTLGTWTNCTLSDIKVTAKVKKTKEVEMQVGWNHWVVAMLGISQSVSVDVDQHYTIPCCTKSVSADWKWLGDRVVNGWYLIFDKGHVGEVDHRRGGGNITPGTYNYSPMFGPLRDRVACTDPPCPEPVSATLLMICGLFLVNSRCRPE